MNFFQNLFSILYNIYFSHQDRLEPFSRKLDFLIFQNSFITFVKKNFLSPYLGWIYLVMGATYPLNMDQIRAGSPRPCLSCYGLSNFSLNISDNTRRKKICCISKRIFDIQSTIFCWTNQKFCWESEKICMLYINNPFVNTQSFFSLCRYIFLIAHEKF